MVKIKDKKKYLQRLFSVIRKNKSEILVAIFLSIIADILFLSSSSDAFIFGILGLSIFSIIFYKLHSSFILKFCLFLLAIMFISFIVSGTSIMTEKAAVWFVLFFGTGIIRQWKE